MRRFAAMLLAGTIGFLLFPVGYAHADVTDGPAAVLTNTLDQANDALGWVGPDITCKPEAFGGPITQETNIVVGKIFASDHAEGHGECVSLNQSTYSVSLTVRIQSFDGSNWVNVGGCNRTSSGSAVRGVAVVVVAPFICNHGDFSDHLDQYHRARAVLTNTVDNVPRTATSAIWYMRRG